MGFSVSPTLIVRRWARSQEGTWLEQLIQTSQGDIAYNKMSFLYINWGEIVRSCWGMCISQLVVSSCVVHLLFLLGLIPASVFYCLTFQYFSSSSTSSSSSLIIIFYFILITKLFLSQLMGLAFFPWFSSLSQWGLSGVSDYMVHSFCS